MDTVAGITQPKRPSEQKSLYVRDHYTWARQQVDALKCHDFATIDWENITEEIQALVTTQESSLRSHYTRIMEHLLKLQYRELRETEPVAGWEISVDNARMEIEDLLQDNPGLKSRRDALFCDAWARSRKRAIAAFVNDSTCRIHNDSARYRERKRLSRDWTRVLPQDNPFTRQQVEDSEWMPERIRLPQRPQGRQQPTPKPSLNR